MVKMNEQYKITLIKLLTLNQISYFNKQLEKQSKKDKGIIYVNRSVPTSAIKALYRLPDCAEEYHSETGSIILTAAYYLKNIIILQGFEDGNHRTALYATILFLNLNGYDTKEIDNECALSFKNHLIMLRYKDYHTIGSLESLSSEVLKIEDNIPIEENYVFEFCLKFIKSEILR